MVIFLIKYKNQEANVQSQVLVQPPIYNRIGKLSGKWEQPIVFRKQNNEQDCNVFADPTQTFKTGLDCS